VFLDTGELELLLESVETSCYSFCCSEYTLKEFSYVAHFCWRTNLQL